MTEQVTKHTGQQTRVLLVGLDELDCAILARLLGESGEVEWGVCTVSTVEEALDELAASHRILARVNLDLEAALGQTRILAHQAQVASEAKGRFLSHMSHEVRTPLNGIIGFADLLAEEPLSETQRTWVATIRDCSGHLLEVLQQVLDASKLDAGRMEVEAIDCELSQVLTSVESMMRPKALAKGLDFSVQVDPQVPPRIRTDPTRLRQCLINLVNNAVKFTAQGSVQVIVELDRSECIPALRFTVADTGIGIPADRQTAIFEPFVQVDAGIARRYGGTGLGLSITKGLVEKMGARSA